MLSNFSAVRDKTVVKVEGDEVERVVLRYEPNSTTDIIRDHFSALLTAILTGNRLDQLIRSQIF
jgi:hypothetical protein